MWGCCKQHLSPIKRAASIPRLLQCRVQQSWKLAAGMLLPAHSVQCDGPLTAAGAPKPQIHLIWPFLPQVCQARRLCRVR